MKFTTIFIPLIILFASFLFSCNAGVDNTGYEYAPNMYHSVAYEPLKQITDKESGMWVNSSGTDIGEYYSSNPLNPGEMNMRLPVANTVKRGKYLPYRIPKDSLLLAAKILKNPLPETKQIREEGKILYGKFCSHCHGSLGVEPGLVGERFAGVTSYTSASVKEVSEGHIFHVITHGKGRMAAHGSQLSQEERWKVVQYVQTLQRQ